MLNDNVIDLAGEAQVAPGHPTRQQVDERTADLCRALAVVEAQKRELEAVLAARDQMQARLEDELRDAQLLHSISAMLIDEHNVDTLYQKLVDVATTIMRSDFGSMQRYDPERNALQLIAHRGLNDEAIAFWQWVRPGQATTCGHALKESKRVIVQDFDACEFIAGSEDGAAFKRAGVNSAQSTPLLTREGHLVGMITTHCTRRCEPNERDLRLLDIVARQAADLIERATATEALRTQARRLVEADRYKDEFLATLAHELRNPLAPITNGLAVLRIGKAEQIPRVLGMMERQVGQMVRLIDDLLDVSRISRGVVALSPARVTLGALIDSAGETSRPLINAAGHNFTVTLPGNIVWLVVDVTRVVQVISNLLNNAAKYTPPGGHIELVAEVIDGQVEIRIIDTGIGISAEMLPKIFELFTQVDGTAKRSQGGLGVGLALSRKFAEMHAGSVEAESAGKGTGSTFTLRLPVAPSPVTAVRTEEERRGFSITGPSSRVLVVDDNADAAETLSLVLQGLGHITHVVTDSRGALAAAREFRPDLAILDIGMPHVSGLDLARQIRQDAELREVWLTALSGWGTVEDQEKSYGAGMNHHLTKPVILQEVLDMLAQAAQRVNGDNRMAHRLG